MLTNDIKKGTKFMLRNGWFATMKDNMKGTIRVAEVKGFVTEIGSVYAHDIITVYSDHGDAFVVEHTPAQKKLRAKIAVMFP